MAVTQNPYKQGWYLGYATTTIASEVTVALLTGGAGSLLTKSAWLAKLAPKFFKAGDEFADAIEGIGFRQLAGDAIEEVPGGFPHAQTSQRPSRQLLVALSWSRA